MVGHARRHKSTALHYRSGACYGKTAEMEQDRAPVHAGIRRPAATELAQPPPMWLQIGSEVHVHSAGVILAEYGLVKLARHDGFLFCMAGRKGADTALKRRCGSEEQAFCKNPSSHAM